MRKRLSAILVLCLSAVMAYGVIGTGAQFLKSVTAQENINVGTFDCLITTPVTPNAIIASDQRSVTYTAPTINTSAAGSAPFSFTVENTGSIDQVLTIATSALGSPFSVIGDPFTPVLLAHSTSTTINTGVQWGELSNANLGASGTETWTVSCGENLPAVIFDNTPAGPSAFYSPNRYYSQSLGAQSETQFGTQVGFAGSARNLQTVTVAMSSWACQTGSWADGSCRTTPGATYNVPITFNVYNVAPGDAVGTQIATVTQTFAIPYRPSADATCPATGQASAGAGFTVGSSCQNGLVSEITFAFAGQTLPNTSSSGSPMPPPATPGRSTSCCTRATRTALSPLSRRSGRSRSRTTCTPTTRRPRSSRSSSTSAASAAPSPPSRSRPPTSNRLDLS